jgi:DNA ligase (NAD+)
MNFKIPDLCPVCSGLTSIEGDFLYCRSKSCPGKLSGSVHVWINRLGLLYWGDALINNLTDSDNSKISSLADLYNLSVDDISSCCSGKKVAKKCYDILHSNKDITLELLLAGINVPNLGTSTATDIVQAGFDTIEKILSIGYDDLLKIPNIGEITARLVFDGIQERRETITQLSKVLVIKKPSSGPLKGISVCITGATSKPRKAVQKDIMDAGGIIKESVGVGLTYLVTNESKDFGSSKMKKAEKLGTKIISEIELYNIINKNGTV